MNAFKTSATVGVLAAALALAACDRKEDARTAGERLDSAVASANQNAREAGQEVKREAAEARSDIQREATAARSELATAASAAGDKMKDASITTAANAELARDSELSALRINVDTLEGRVVLRGSAPSEAARSRATLLAQRVEGVLSVDNQLSVSPKG